MSLITLYRCDDGIKNRGTILVKQTKKSLKVPDEGSFTYSLYPSQGIYNTPVNVTFPSGKVRQVVLLWKGKSIEPTLTEADVSRSVLRADLKAWARALPIADHPRGHWFHGRLHFIKHRDDKIYSVPRWVIVRNSNYGGNELIYDLSRFNEFAARGDTDELVLVEQKWLRWGDKEFLYCNGFDWRMTFGRGDDQCDFWTPKKHWSLSNISSKNVSEFPTNPFAEGELATPRYRHPMPQGGVLYVKQGMPADLAVKSFLWKREIAEAVFRPERVAKMIDRYGMEWIEEIA